MMSILLVLSVAAHAADVATYGLVAPVDLPAAGTVRLALPADLVAGDAATLERGLLLADASGRGVPYAVLRSSAGGGTETEGLGFRPVDGTTWETDAAEAPVDALTLDVYDLAAAGPFQATVAWRDGGEWRTADRALLYAVDGAEDRTVEVPHVTGPFRVTLTGYDANRPRLLDLVAIRNAPDHVPPIEEAVPVPTPVVTEAGYARYTLRLGGVRTVRGLRFSLPESVDVLDREVLVRIPGPDLHQNLDTVASGRIRRLKVGRASVDRLELPLEGFMTDTLVVEIPLERGAPLPLDGIDVISEGVYLVARDAGPGPHRVYGAATVADDAYDLAVAVPELLRPLPPVVAVGEPAPNPAFVPVPTREEVDGAGPDLTLARFAFERPIVGSGWVRVPLGRDVLARTRADVGDVRVVDAEGRQLPFLLWDTGEEEAWAVGEVERKEEAGSTLLRIPLDGTAPVATVQLETSRAVFERPVTVLRDAGRTTVAIRHVIWNGPEKGGTLAIALDERVGDTLLVRIDNGDDAPIPIDAVRVTSPVRELRVRVPEGGARLVYGAPGAGAPSYDLALLRDEVRRMPVADATLGEERALAPPTPGIVDRGATLVGVGLLAIGLLGMVARVVRGVPEPSKG